ncbi:MAG: phage holin [Bacilli bacterium]|nr:phage holin [Bacilli bacterium]
MSNKVYDVLKWITLVFMPALITLTGVILNCFNVQNADVILTIMTAVETFMGSLLGVSNINYKKSNK